jgi:hypothetical protein
LVVAWIEFTGLIVDCVIYLFLLFHYLLLFDHWFRLHLLFAFSGGNNLLVKCILIYRFAFSCLVI